MENVSDVDVKNMLPYERIKYYREEVVDLSQSKFANNLKISKSNLANIEVGRVNLTDRVISEICEAYNINEDWIKFGTKPMQKQKSRDEEIVDFFKKVKNTNNVFAKRFILALSKLDVQDWEALDKLITNYAELKNENTIKQSYVIAKKPKSRTATIVYNKNYEKRMLEAYDKSVDDKSLEFVNPIIAEKTKG